MNIDPADKDLFNCTAVYKKASDLTGEFKLNDIRCSLNCYSDYLRLSNLRMNAVCKRIQREHRAYYSAQ